MSPRAALERVYRAALDAVHGEAAVRRALEDETGGGPLRLLGAGKAACAMARGALAALGPRAIGGVVVTRDGHALSVDPLDVLEASHPLPDARGLAAAERLLAEAASAPPGTGLLVLLSGGASALLVAPVPGVSLDAKRDVTARLLRAGAPIEDLNAVRKHLSRIKGGGLARAAAGRPVLTLAISDVAGDRLDVIGSGPTAPDPTRYADALGVLERCGIDGPPEVLEHLRAGAAGRVAETPGPDDPVFARVRHRIVARLDDALTAAADAAAALGWEPLQLGRILEGEARACAPRLAHAARRAREGREAGDGGGARRMLIAGGEPTVTVRGEGRGGRAQELALALALELAGETDLAALVCGTDGNDGPTDAAGACVDGASVARARAAGLDPRAHLERNDAYPLLRATGDLVRTGPTHTNVTDLALVAVG